MICISIGEYGYNACKKALKKCESIKGRFAESLVGEIRLDVCGLDDEEVELLFSESEIPLIANMRMGEDAYLLDVAIEMGTAYIDLDIYGSRSVIKKYVSMAHLRGIKVILSVHDFNSTPKLSKLRKLYHLALEYGADMFKVVTSASTIEEAERTMELYTIAQEAEFAGLPVSAFTMGKKWAYTTLYSCFNNAPIVFCSYDTKNYVAEEHFTFKQLTNLLELLKGVKGELVAPASRDVALRAMLAASLAKGESTIKGYSSNRDLETAVSLLEFLDINIDLNEDILSVFSSGILNYTSKKNNLFSISSSDSLLSELNSLSLFVGESRLLSRFILPIAAQFKKKVIVTGDGQVLNRDMFGVKDALEEMGVSCILSEKSTLPAIVNGPLSGGEITLSGKRGAPFISGLLMALPLSNKDSQLIIVEPSSVDYLLLTVSVIRRFGIEVDCRRDDNRLVFDIKGKQSYSATDIDIEGDWCSAAQFLVGAAIFGEIEVKGLQLDSLQAENIILDVLQNSGARVSVSESCIKVKRGHLKPFVYDAKCAPTLVSILIVLAAFCEGESQIIGIERLITRSNTELKALIAAFVKSGVDIKLVDTTLRIKGMSLARRIAEKKMLKGGSFSSSADHRIAMALKIAHIATKDNVSIDNTAVIAKSYKDFDSVYSSIIQ